MNAACLLPIVGNPILSQSLRDGFESTKENPKNCVSLFGSAGTVGFGAVLLFFAMIAGADAHRNMDALTAGASGLGYIWGGFYAYTLIPMFLVRHLQPRFCSIATVFATTHVLTW